MYKMQEYYVVKDGQIIADELTLSEVLEYQRFHGYSLAVHEEAEVRGEYKSMWICAPGFIAVFGTVFLAFWVVQMLSGFP